jgi:hypothetical protein
MTLKLMYWLRNVLCCSCPLCNMGFFWMYLQISGPIMYYVFNVYWTYVISVLGLLGANVITRFLYIFKNNCDYAPNLSCFYFSHNVISLQFTYFSYFNYPRTLCDCYSWCYFSHFVISLPISHNSTTYSIHKLFPLSD